MAYILPSNNIATGYNYLENLCEYTVNCTYMYQEYVYMQGQMKACPKCSTLLLEWAATAVLAVYDRHVPASFLIMRI